MCPHCRSDAPLLYRGVRAYCSACGAPRTVLSAASLTYAGAPQQVGGAVVRVFGWAFLLVGLSIGAIVALLTWLVFTATAGLITFGIFAAFSAAFFFMFRAGGKRLAADGEGERDLRREQAVSALAKNRGGVLLARDAAAALDTSVEEADAFLTRLAKRSPDRVGVEIGDAGEVFYTFSRHVGGSFSWSAFLSWGGSRPGGSRYRVPQPVRVETSGFSGMRGGRYADDPSAASPTSVALSKSTPPKIIDADFEEIDEPSSPAPKRLTR